MSPSVVHSNSEMSSEISKYQLSDDRAASIGWYFIESYYDFFNHNVESIFKLYHSDAVLIHSGFPSNDVRNVVYKASGTETIRKYFSEQESEKIKNCIVISRADIQVCLNDKILIVVFGEWSRDSSSFFTFTQTFLLCPGKKENTFDLANDNLRFFDFQEFGGISADSINSSVDIGVADEPVKVIEQVQVENGKEPSDKKSDSKSNSESKISSKLSDELESANVALESNGEKDSSHLAESTNEKIVASSGISWTDLDDEEVATSGLPNVNVGGRSQTDAQDASFSNKTSNVEAKEPSELNGGIGSEEKIDEELNDKNPQPISWAALAASSSKSPTTAAQKPLPKKGPQPIPQGAPHPPQPSSNGKYKKEDWFPIYIRGVKDLDEEVLKKHLVKKFGEIKFFRIFVNIALCDFVDGESQKKALSAKETVVDGTVIQLEVRESKNNNKSGPKNPKEKNSNTNSVNNEKRKSEKKQVGKKGKASSKNID